MPSRVFKRADSEYLVPALAVLPHTKLNLLEHTLEFPDSREHNKDDRALAIVTQAFEAANTDELLEKILEHVHRNRWARDSDEYKTLEQRVFSVRGVEWTDDGFVFPQGASPRASTRSAQRRDTSQPAPAPRRDRAVGETSREMSQPLAELKMMRKRDKSKVFIVHGRNTAAKESLETFLHFLSLGTISWREAVTLTGKSQPHTYDIVKTGMDHAAAIIILFTPDDEARVKEQFSTPDDPDRQVQGQARQNVILEAGMAFAYAQERTIFLQGGRTRPISDIEGFNWVKLNGTFESRADLRDRLRAAGAQVHQRNEDLLHHLAGAFTATS